MSLIAFEGFDNISSTGVSTAMDQWVVLPGSGTVTAQTGRFGATAIRPTASGTTFAGATVQGFIGRIFPSATNVTFGGAFNIQAGSGNQDVLFCWNGPGGTTAAFLTVPAGGGPLVLRSGLAAQNTIANGTISLSTGVWYYIEVQIDTVALTTTVRINGVQDISIAGSSAQGGSTSIVAVGLGMSYSTAPSALAATYQGFYFFDDFYVLNNSGTVNTTFLGDVKVVNRLATSATLKTFTPLSGTNNFDMINEVIQDGDTTYVSGSAVNTVDHYQSTNTLGGIPVSVYGVSGNFWARKDDATVRALSADIVSGAAQVSYGSATMSTVYARYQIITEVDPATSAPWLPNAVLACQFGPRVLT